jgi:methylated-DNA-[protein]-cysteine S-methyltransferase
VHPSPVGDLLLVGDGRSLNGLYMLPDHRYGPTVGAHWRLDPAFFAETGRQLDDYFAGRLVSFDLPLAPRGSDFQCAVWRELTAIEHGRVTSYGAVAAALGRPTAARAVGAANGRNPISIIVPCHRVVGADGSLTGYGGGLERKQALLDLERRAPVHPGKTGPSARRRVVDQVGVASHDHRVPHREQQR